MKFWVTYRKQKNGDLEWQTLESEKKPRGLGRNALLISPCGPFATKEEADHFRLYGDLRDE